MKQATIFDAPQVLNTNDRAMWVLGYNTAVQQAAAPAQDERVAFRAKYSKLLDLSEEATYGGVRFKHSHVEALWEGWRSRAASGPA